MKKNYFLLLGIMSWVFFLPIQAMLGLHNKILWDSQDDECHIAKLSPDNLGIIACHSYDIYDVTCLKSTCKWITEKLHINDFILDCQFRNKGFKDFSFSQARSDSSLCLKMLRNLAYERYKFTQRVTNIQEKIPLYSPKFCAKLNLINQGINILWKTYPRAHCLSNNKRDGLFLLVETQNPDIDKYAECLQKYIEYRSTYAKGLDIELVKQVLLESNKFGRKSIDLLSCILKLGNNELVHIFLDKVDKEQLSNFGLKFWNDVFIKLAGWREYEALSYFIQNNMEKEEKESFFESHTSYILKCFLSDTKNFLCRTHSGRLEYETDRFHRTFDLLLENSCNINHQIFSDNSGTILHYVCSEPDDEYSWSKIEVVKKLLQYKADINVVNSSGETLLHVACIENCSLSLTELLINKGANVDAVDNNGNTPLHFAFCFDNLEIARILLAKGANPNIRCAQGCTPLNCISSRTSPEMVELLCEFNADPNIVDNKGRVPLEQYGLKKKNIEDLHRYEARSHMPTITKVKIIFGSALLISAAICFYLYKTL